MLKKILTILLKYSILAVCFYLLQAITTHMGSFTDLLDFNFLQNYFIASGIFTIVYLALLKNRVVFWETLLHEFTHVLFAMLFLNKIDSINASGTSGGNIEYTGQSNWLINLAPYFFPLLSFLLMLLGLIVSDEILLTLNYIIAVSYCWFMLTAFRQFSFRQSDIQKAGLFFSAVFLPIANALIVFFMLFYLDGKIMEFLYTVNKYAFESSDMLIDTWLSLRSFFN